MKFAEGWFMPHMNRGPRWLLIAAVAVFAALAIGIFVAQDQQTLRVESAVAAADPAFPGYISALIGVPVEHGDAFVVLQNGDEVFPAMLDAIERAQTRISFETYIYADDAVGQRFTVALAAAARRGVTVRVVLDSVGVKLEQDSVDLLERSGVQVAWFNLLRPWLFEEVNYRTHRKILVVDGVVGFTGGVGLAKHWLGSARTPDEWRDTHVRIDGPTVRALEAGFYENWIEASEVSMPVLSPRPHSQGSEARTLTVWTNPSGGASRLKLLYLLSIAAARASIDIQSPYFILDEATHWALDAARRRGVRVRILTEGLVTDALPVKHASRQAYQTLLDAGYEIFEYQPTMMHVKAMIVDGVWSVFGSANFDNRSFELNDELTIAVAGSVLAGELTRDFEADLTRARRLDAASWPEARSVFVKAQEWFWSIFRELL